MKKHNKTIILCLIVFITMLLISCNDNEQYIIKPEYKKEFVKHAEILNKRISNNENETNTEYEDLIKLSQSMNKDNSKKIERQCINLLLDMSLNLSHYNIYNEIKYLEEFKENHQQLKNLVGVVDYDKIAKKLDI